jgi:hypothetical protein
MALVIKSFLLSACAEWLTGTTPCPHWSVRWPSSEPQGLRPSSDPGKEMTLGIAFKVVARNVGDGSVIDISIWD